MGGAVAACFLTKKEIWDCGGVEKVSGRSVE